MRKNLIIAVLVAVALLATSAAVSKLGAQSRATGKEYQDPAQKGPYQMVADSKEGVWVLDVKNGRVKYCTMNHFGSVTSSGWSDF
jgi:flagellar basal body-associated protein FliL